MGVVNTRKSSSVSQQYIINNHNNNNLYSLLNYYCIARRDAHLSASSRAGGDVESARVL